MALCNTVKSSYLVRALNSECSYSYGLYVVKSSICIRLEIVK